MVVRAGGGVGSSAPIVASLGYRFDSQFDLIAGEATEEYREAHARLRVLPEIGHPFGPRDEREIAQVKEWKGDRFVPVRVGRPGARPTAAR